MTADGAGGLPFDLPPRVREQAERAARRLADRGYSEPVGQPDGGAEALQLPLWDDSRRAIPNEYARAAIFTVRNKKIPRKSVSNQRIFVVGTSVITYTGIELRAYDDELVWMQILHIAKEYPLGSVIEFTYYQVCKALAWPTSGAYYEKIHECLLRLKATAVAVHNARLGKGRAISFVQLYEWADAAGDRLSRCRVSIHPDMQTLFAGHHFTELEWNAYLRLSPIARRLYDYAASHKKPHALKLETVRGLCGSDSTTRDRRWKEQVLKALAELVACGLISSGDVRVGLVFFER